MGLAKAPGPSPLDIKAALHAICSTGIGRCWYCDRKLPREDKAVRGGWQVRRVEGDRVASIILVCPHCLREQAKLGEQEFLPFCNAAY
jgi:hypothetical protein